jgi:hypothetical protein
MWNTQKFWLPVSLLPFALLSIVLTSCGFFGDETSYYSVEVVNECGDSKDIYIDGSFQDTVGSGRNLTITKIEEGSHTLRAAGIDPLRVYFDQDKIWTLCP